jgi:hypothetical protein
MIYLFTPNFAVIPAKAGTQLLVHARHEPKLDPRLRGDDEFTIVRV